MQGVNNKKVFAVILAILCIGLIIYEMFLTEKRWCYRDGLGRIQECSNNITYLKEKYGLGELKIDYSKLKIGNNS